MLRMAGETSHRLFVQIQIIIACNNCCLKSISAILVSIKDNENGFTKCKAFPLYACGFYETTVD